MFFKDLKLNIGEKILNKITPINRGNILEIKNIRKKTLHCIDIENVGAIPNVKFGKDDVILVFGNHQFGKLYEQVMLKTFEKEIYYFNTKIGKNYADIYCSTLLASIIARKRPKEIIVYSNDNGFNSTYEVIKSQGYNNISIVKPFQNLDNIENYKISKEMSENEFTQYLYKMDRGGTSIIGNKKSVPEQKIYDSIYSIFKNEEDTINFIALLLKNKIFYCSNGGFKRNKLVHNKYYSEDYKPLIKKEKKSKITPIVQQTIEKVEAEAESQESKNNVDLLLNKINQNVSKNPKLNQLLVGVSKNQFISIVQNFVDFSSFIFPYKDIEISEWINMQIDNKIIKIKKDKYYLLPKY